MNSYYQKGYRSVYNLTAHFVFVTKYRRKILTNELLNDLEEILRSILKTRECQLVEFNGEADHVHLIVSYKPDISISNLVANLKSTSSKQLWQKHAKLLSKTYWGALNPDKGGRGVFQNQSQPLLPSPEVTKLDPDVKKAGFGLRHHSLPSSMDPYSANTQVQPQGCPPLSKISFAGKRVLWTGSYFVSSCGGATIEQLRKYVENQNRPTT